MKQDGCILVVQEGREVPLDKQDGCISVVYQECVVSQGQVTIFCSHALQIQHMQTRCIQNMQPGLRSFNT